MATFTDISNWNGKLFYQTGGTRDKLIVENPENSRDYYFKTSLKKEIIDYKYEFWSEIIASEVGSFLGFPLLKYDIAFRNPYIGCLSESMNTNGKSTLTEGVRYLTSFNSNYNPKDKRSKSEYSFQFIESTFRFFNLDRFINNVIEIIIFDSIIGNGDRHQENWGIITDYKIPPLLEKKNNPFLRMLYKIGIIKVKNITYFQDGDFSPIYDSGSCLGRELEDAKVIQMIRDNNMLENYINKGVSEIHWDGKKLTHFELIRVISTLYPEYISKSIKRTKARYDDKSLSDIVNHIDDELPESLIEKKLPAERKELIIKLITSRYHHLINLGL
jgi:hypothetical protein